MDLLRYRQMGEKLRHIIDEKDIADAQQMALEQYKKAQTGAEALENKEIYPHLMSLIGKEVKAGDRVRFGDELYRIDADHVVQVDIYPGKAEAAKYFAKVLPTDAPYQELPRLEDIEIWAATEIYKRGQIVVENKKVYESLIDDNFDRPSESEGKSWKYLHDLTK